MKSMIDRKIHGKICPELSSLSNIFLKRSLLYSMNKDLRKKWLTKEMVCFFKPIPKNPVTIKNRIDQGCTFMSPIGH